MRIAAARRLIGGGLSAVLGAIIVTASLSFLATPPASATPLVAPNIDWLVSSGAISLLDNWVGNDLLSTNAFDNPNTFVSGHPREHWTTSATSSFTAYGPPNNPGSFEYALANNLIPHGTTYVLYDTETWSLTPTAEQQDPELYMSEFVQLAADYGYKAILAPAIDLTSSMPCYRPNDTDWGNYLYDCNLPGLVAEADPAIYEVQAQRFESSPTGQRCDCFDWFVDEAASSATSYSPDLDVFAGISSNHSGVLATGTQLANDVLDTQGIVDGFWLNIPVASVACPSCAVTGDPGSAADMLWDLGYVGVGYQSITLGPATPGTVGGSEQLSAIGGGSAAAVRFSVDPSSSHGACTLGADGVTLSFGVVGQCVVDANQPASTNYLAAAQVSQTISVSAGAQSISFVPPAADVVGDRATLAATGGLSGNPVVFKVDPSSSPGACALGPDGVTLSYTGAGTCIIDANEAASANYQAAPQVTGTVQIGPRSQAISFTAPATATNGTTLTLGASGGLSGNPVTFSLDPASGPGVCNLSGVDDSTVDFVAVGNCVVDANEASSGRNFLAAPPVVRTIAVVPGSQTVSFVPPEGGVVGGTSPLVAIGGESSQAVLFSVDPSSGAGVCNVSGPDGDQVEYTGVGECVIDASQLGDANYTAAPPVTGFIRVGQASQSISFAPPDDAAYGGSEQLFATGGASGNPVEFSIDPTSDPVCSLSGDSGAISYIGIGNCIVDLEQAGNADYLAAPTVVATIAVGGDPQSISFAPPASGVFGGSTVLSASGGASGNAVVFAVDPSSTAGACALGSDGVTLGYTGVGNCVVDASQASAGTYAPGEVVATIPVLPAPQTVTAPAPPDGQVGDTYPLSGSGGASGNPVVFAVDPLSGPGVCNVVGPPGGESVDYSAAGSCVLDAQQAASTDYQAAATTLAAAAVSAGAQQISFQQTPAGMVGTAGVLVATSGVASGIPIVFSVDASSDPGVCSISPARGSTVVYTGVGNCVVDADQGADADYLAAPEVSESITVGPGEQTLTVSAPPTASAGTSAVLSGSGGLSSNPIVFTIDSSSGPGVCSAGGANGATVTFAGVGSCVVDADKAGDDNYQAAPTVVSTIVVTPGTQAISFAAPATGTVGDSSVLAATDADGGSQPITFSIDPSSDPGVCSVAPTAGGAVLSYSASGNCLVDADQAADANFSAAPTVSAAITVGPGPQSIAFDPSLSGQVGGSETLSASTSSSSGIPVLFSVDGSTAPGVCSVSGTHGQTLSFVGVGSCIVEANEAGDADYDAAPTVTATIAVAPGTQAISFTPPSSGVPGTNAVLSATSSVSTGIPIVFSIDSSTAAGVCSLSGPNGSLATYAGPGQCTVDANEAGNGNYLAAPTVARTITVALGTQQINFTPPAGAVVGGSATLTATGGATGNPIVFSVDPATVAGVCAVSGQSGSLVSYAAAGACVIDANEVGNADYFGATPDVQTITVAPARGVISFPTPPAVIGVVETLVATTNSGNPVVFTLDPTSGPGVCSLSGIDNATVTYTALGSCVVDANSAGTANYLTAPQVQVTIHVKVGSQFITFAAPVSDGVGTSTTLAATTSGGSGNPIVYSVDWASDPDVCEVSGPNGSKLSYLSLGTCVIDANQAGNTYYHAAPTMWAAIEVGPGPQVITYTSQPASPQYGGSYVPAATGGASGNPVVFSTSTPSVCTLSYRTVYFVGVGTCTVDANQDGDDEFQPAVQLPQSFTVSKVAQTVSFTSTAPAGAVYGGSYSVSVAGGASGNAVILSSATPSVCTIKDLFTVIFVSSGACTVDANEAGNSHYLPGQASQSFAVGPASQKIVVNAVPGVYGGSETLGVVAGASGSPVVLSIDAKSGAGVCSMANDGKTVEFTAVGSCVVDANEAGNADYSAAPQVQVTIAVGRASQSITFSTPSTSFYGSTVPLAASASSGLPVSFAVDASSGAGVCTVTAGPQTALQFTAGGTCVVDAIQAGNADYSAAPKVEQKVVVSKAAQAISFTAPQTATYGQSATLAATGGGSGNPIVFSISSISARGVCTVSGDVVDFTGAGSCVVNANQAGNADYNSAPLVRQTITVGKASQTVTITSTAPAHATYLGASYAISATGGGSGKPVVFSSDSKSVCTVSGATVNFVGGGNCTILAVESGTADYFGASATQKFTVYRVTQTVTFTSVPPTGAKVGQQYTVAANGGGSGLAITFTSLSGTVCAVSGSTVTLLAAGTCTVEAHEAGNTDYLPATATQKFNVGKATSGVGGSAGAWWGLIVAGVLRAGR